MEDFFLFKTLQDSRKKYLFSEKKFQTSLLEDENFVDLKSFYKKYLKKKEVSAHSPIQNFFF